MSDHEVRVVQANKEGQLGFSFTKGGLREGAGRKGIGITKKQSLTLPENLWRQIERECEERDMSRSELIRSIIVNHYANNEN